MPDEPTDSVDESLDSAAATEPLPASVEVDSDFLREAKRALREEELNSPAVRRFLLADVERLTRDCSELKQDVQRLRSLETEVEVLKVHNDNLKHRNRTNTVLFGIASVGAGAAPSYVQESAVGWIFLVLFIAAMVVTGTERFKA